MKKFIYGIVTAVVLIMLAGSAILISGLYNVAADVPHWKMTFMLLDEARDISISRHSRDINVKLPVDQAAMDMGFEHYHEMCRLCHGAPGSGRTEFAEGLYPSPPRLDTLEIKEEIGRAGIIWVVRHGLKMTGMPSFEKTHTDEQIKSIVAFTEKLSDISPEKYKEMIRAGDGESSEMHQHEEEMGHMEEQMESNSQDHAHEHDEAH